MSLGSYIRRLALASAIIGVGTVPAMAQQMGGQPPIVPGVEQDAGQDWRFEGIEEIVNYLANKKEERPNVRMSSRLPRDDVNARMLYMSTTDGGYLIDLIDYGFFDGRDGAFALIDGPHPDGEVDKYWITRSDASFKNQMDTLINDMATGWYGLFPHERSDAVQMQRGYHADLNVLLTYARNGGPLDVDIDVYNYVNPRWCAPGWCGYWGPWEYPSSWWDFGPNHVWRTPIIIYGGPVLNPRLPIVPRRDVIPPRVPDGRRAVPRDSGGGSPVVRYPSGRVSAVPPGTSVRPPTGSSSRSVTPSRTLVRAPTVRSAPVQRRSAAPPIQKAPAKPRVKKD